MTTRAVLHSDLAIPPGEYLAEVIVELGITKDELARRMSRPATKLSAIFGGGKAITPDTALQLEKVIGVPAHIWTGLEAEYRLTLARQHENEKERQPRGESGLLKKFCYKELAGFGFVAKRTKTSEKVLELQRFFGVTSLRNLSGLKRYEVAFRRGGGRRKRSPEALAAWLRIGEIAAQKAACKPFDGSKLENSFSDIRSLTMQPPERFEQQLQNILSEAGVILVLAPHLPKTYAHGATFWLNAEKAVLMLTIRGRYADIFWFSLFHEICHILRHQYKQGVILENYDFRDVDQALEDEANGFAADTLIPPEAYQQFVETASFHKEAISRFARHLNIDTGVVVGRLQHDDHIPKSWHNQLRSRHQWKMEFDG
jgi:HTH-type transcriptional regulator/antitoxin HigA